jgi:hypothetical protein
MHEESRKKEKKHLFFIAKKKQLMLNYILVQSLIFQIPIFTI